MLITPCSSGREKEFGPSGQLVQGPGSSCPNPLTEEVGDWELAGGGVWDWHPLISPTVLRLGGCESHGDSFL